jgi:hypothetical protein
VTRGGVTGRWLLLGRTTAIAIVERDWKPREAFHVHGPSRLRVALSVR